MYKSDDKLEQMRSVSGEQVLCCPAYSKRDAEEVGYKTIVENIMAFTRLVTYLK